MDVAEINLEVQRRYGAVAETEGQREVCGAATAAAGGVAHLDSGMCEEQAPAAAGAGGQRHRQAPHQGLAGGSECRCRPWRVAIEDDQTRRGAQRSPRKRSRRTELQPIMLSKMPRRRLVLAAVVSASITMVAFGFPFLGAETEWAWEKCVNGAPKGMEGTTQGWSWWPVGTRCRLSQGRDVVATVVVPPWRGDAWADER